MTKTNDEIYEVVLDTKKTVLDVKGDLIDLRDHVNHRMTNFETALSLKQDKNSLLQSFAFKLLNNKVARWTLGALAAATVSSAVVVQWNSPLANIVKFILRLF